MPISVEARGVQVSDRLSDLILCAAHVPVELDELEFHAFVARTLEVPPTSLVSATDLAEARDAIGRWSWDWDRKLPALAERCLQAVVLGNFGPAAGVEWPLLPPFAHPHVFEELFHRTRRLPRHARSRLALDAAGRLDWGPLGESNDPEIEADLASIFEHQIGIGQSPPVKPFSVRELVRNPRALVLAPIASGSVGAAGAIPVAAVTGNWAVVLLSAGAGAGATIVIGSGLWLAAKLMAAIRHLEAAPGRRPRRTRTKPGEAATVDQPDPDEK